MQSARRELPRSETSGINGLRRSSFRPRRETPHNRALRIICQCPEHVKNQPPLCGRRVEGFGQAAKTDASQAQGLDGFDQLLHRPRQMGFPKVFRFARRVRQP